MNDLKFDALMSEHAGRLGQQPEEWRLFLEFARGYFKIRRVETPVVVEIGTMNNLQKSFYQELLGAEHIGIDPAGNAEIVGRSQDPAALLQLQTMLHGREIDLLFIDGDHTYRRARADYEIYGELTRHIVALHDISHRFTPAIPEETMRLWEEISASERRWPLIAIKSWNAATEGITAGRQMGIGLVLKGVGT
jgi:hypothetical protein